MAVFLFGLEKLPINIPAVYIRFVRLGKKWLFLTLNIYDPVLQQGGLQGAPVAVHLSI